MNVNPFDPKELEKIPEPASPPVDAPSDASTIEELSLDLARKKEELRRAQNDNNWREKIPSHLWWLTVGWLASVLLITVLSGLNKIEFFDYIRLHYEPGVLIALISSTTASVIGMYTILLRYLFPDNIHKP